MASLSYRARFWWDHRWTTTRLSDYLDGSLGPRAGGRAKRHVGECEQCRAALADLRAIVEALHRLTAPAGGGDPRETAALVLGRLRES
jgi:anti-sigma factor RsiW